MKVQWLVELGLKQKGIRGANGGDMMAFGNHLMQFRGGDGLGNGRGSAVVAGAAT